VNIILLNNVWRYVWCLAGLVVLSGCPAGLNRVPGSTERRIDPDSGSKFLLYIPSWHSNETRWPLVVTCHGTEPYDTADLQIREWRQLAERVGFIVAAPQLACTDGMTPTTAKTQVARQRADEKLILSIVRKTIASLNVNPDRVYLAGWSGGGYAVYYTGLRNPSVFRALAARMGTFKESYLPGIANRLDPYQSVGIFFGSSDVLPGVNAQCRKAYAFLKRLGGKRVRLQEIPGGHGRRPEIAFDFFKAVTEKYALVRPTAVTGVGGDPLEVQFYVKVDPPAMAVVWDFGDGSVGTNANARHHYAKPGEYLATVTVITSRRARTERKLKLDLGG